MAPRAHLYTRDIESIDPLARTVTLSPGVRPTPLSLNYEHLVIALGTRLDYGKIPGMHEHGSPFNYLGDALFLRNQLVRMLEEAEAERDPEIRKRLLTFVVAGAGFSGVRCIAEMNEFLREAVSVYHNIVENDLRLILLQRSDRILPEVTASLASAQKLLAKRGVEIRLSTELKAVTANAVTVADRRTHQIEIISTRTAVVTAPAAPHPILTTPPLPQNNGRIVVDQTTEVPGWSQVWAIGDCAEIKQADGKISPATADHAMRQAKTCAQNIVALCGAPQKAASGSRGLEDLDPLVADRPSLKF
jgi:NADH:ubiquinone reductase (H+-translocating)